jgi:uncharacterized protein
LKPFTLLIKPSGSDCNIDCEYCFYKHRDPDAGTGRQRMSKDVLERIVAEYMQTGFGVVGFAWQGGEPTLMGLDFFKLAVDLQKEYGTPGQQISNKIQTNGLLLDDNWCRFFHDNKFLLGISIDGPEKFHNLYRRDHSGRGTFDKVMQGIENCKKHEVEFNALVVLNNANVEHPDEIFDFLVQNDISYAQFIPCIETDDATNKPTDFSITPAQYGSFLCRIFDLWFEHGPEKMNIRQFDSLTTYHVLGNHTMCTFSKQCTGFVVLEHTGDAYCCEFFIEPQWRLGNILETPLAKLAQSKLKRTFARNKQSISNKCLICRHLDYCRGGCTKDRTRTGEDQSHFCQSYKQLFDHTIPRFKQIAAKIQNSTMDRKVRPADKIRLIVK